jgi:hypothetical protein
MPAKLKPKQEYLDYVGDHMEGERQKCVLCILGSAILKANKDSSIYHFKSVHDT